MGKKMAARVNFSSALVIDGKVYADRTILSGWLRCTRDTLKNWTHAGLSCHAVGYSARLYDIDEVIDWMSREQKQTVRRQQRLADIKREAAAFKQSLSQQRGRSDLDREIEQG